MRPLSSCHWARMKWMALTKYTVLAVFESDVKHFKVKRVTNCNSLPAWASGRKHCSCQHVHLSLLNYQSLVAVVTHAHRCLSPFHVYLCVRSFGWVFKKPMTKLTFTVSFRGLLWMAHFSQVSWFAVWKIWLFQLVRKLQNEFWERTWIGWGIRPCF